MNVLLSIVVPAYNERRYIDEVLARIHSVDFASLGLTAEVIVVDDMSSDGTWEALQSWERRNAIRLIRHAKNRGKGAALQSGFKEARGEILVVQDADLEYHPRELLKLLAPIIEDKADVVFGSRFAGGEPHRVLYFWHTVGNKFLTLISNVLTDLNLTDMEVCYKAFRSDVLAQVSLKEERFGFEPEFTAKCARLAKQEGIRIYEVGISYSGRTYAEGKKIGWKDGIWTLWCILKYNLHG
jgi:glycosyltransferase involved in cell wall biosynthesis